jgi:hypothetical protein
LVAGFFFVLFAEIVEFTDGYALFFDTFLPNFEVLAALFLLSFALLFFFLHAEDLAHLRGTSASSGMAKGLSYLGTLTEGSLGTLPLRESSSKSLVFISYINSWPIVPGAYEQSGRRFRPMMTR